MTSPLLRLPLEIRNKIWSEVLGDRLVHFRYLYGDKVSFEVNEDLHAGMHSSQKPQRRYGSPWRHVVCERDCPEAQEDRKSTTSEGQLLLMQSHHACESNLGYETPEPDRIYKEWCYPGHQTMCLSVLRSCRQIYVEANNILWTSNTFSFADPTTFRRFLMTRSINQRRLIKSLRMQVGRFSDYWNKSLTMALVRSLSGLRYLRLNIEYKLLESKKLLFDSYESAKSFNYLYITSYFVPLQKLSALPLTKVEIVVENRKDAPENHLWTKMDRQDFAEGLRKTLLDPKGAEIFAEDRRKWRKQCWRQKEDAEKIKASSRI